MTTESPPRPYDVWQMSFEYEDQPGVAKVCPVVIGAVGVATTAVPTRRYPKGPLAQGLKIPHLKLPTESRLLKVCKNPLKPPDLVDELGRIIQCQPSLGDKWAPGHINMEGARLKTQLDVNPRVQCAAGKLYDVGRDNVVAACENTHGGQAVK